MLITEIRKNAEENTSRVFVVDLQVEPSTVVKEISAAHQLFDP